MFALEICHYSEEYLQEKKLVAAHSPLHTAIEQEKSSQCCLLSDFLLWTLSQDLNTSPFW